MIRPLPAAPSYGATDLAGVLPSAAASLGVKGFRGALPQARGAVVVLVDGLGAELLRARSGHAPFMRTLMIDAASATAGFPSTTATSMGTFGTGLPPGSHGLLGYQVVDPATDLLFNELSWENGPDPRRWQREPTVFERVAAAGIETTMVANDYFDGSGLTTAALRGAGFATAATLAQRVDIVLARVARQPRSLTYLYWGNLDRTGHEFGCESWEWVDELEAVDAELQRLSTRLPRGVSLTITADHGMIDIPESNKTDIAFDPELAAGVRHTGGEMRSLQLYCEPGATDDVLAAWTARLGEQGWVLPMADAVSRGLFGPVQPHIAPRLGDVLVAMDGPYGYWDSRVMTTKVGELTGQHGSLTAAEMAVPVLHRPAD